MKVNFKPSPGLILISVIEVKPREKKKNSDLLLPDQAKGKASNYLEVEEVFDEHPYQGIVMAVGENQGDIILDVKEGDKVLLRRALTPSDAVLVKGKVYGIIRQSDIFGKLI